MKTNVFFRVKALSMVAFLLMPANFCLANDIDVESETVSQSTMDTDSQSNSTSNSGLVSATDVFLMYQPDVEDFGLSLSYPIQTIPYLSFVMQLNSNLKFGSDNTTSYGFFLGFGLTPRFVSGNFLLQGKLYPYLGYSGADTPKTIGRFKTKDVNSEFTYGASAEASVGFKIANFKDDDGLFLTFGYKVFASEFKTENLFDYGYWMVGLVIRK